MFHPWQFHLARNGHFETTESLVAHLGQGDYFVLASVRRFSAHHSNSEGDLLILNCSIADPDEHLYRYSALIPHTDLLPSPATHCRRAQFESFLGSGVKLQPEGRPDEAVHRLLFEDGSESTISPEHDAYFLKLREADGGLEARLYTYQRAAAGSMGPKYGEAFDYTIPLQSLLWRSDHLDDKGNPRSDPDGRVSLTRTGRMADLGIPMKTSPIHVERA